MSEMNNEEIGQRIKETREQKGLTQQTLADKVGISRSLLSKFENGSRNLSDEKIQQLFECLLTEENDGCLEAIVDYLTIHFFSTDYEKLINEVLGITMNHMVFYESSTLGYTGRYNLMRAIDIRTSQDTVKGTLFELKGTGCRFLAGWLKAREQTWNDFFKCVLEHGGNFTRIDLALNDYEGVLKLPDLAKKIERNEFHSTFRVGDVYHSKDFANQDSHGVTLYFGSRKSMMYFCFYQKDYEQRRKKQIPLEEADIINRYELRTRHEKSDELIHQLLKTENIEPIIFALINHSICFYDRPVDDPKAKIDRDWQRFIGNHGELALSLESKPMTLEKSFMWLLKSVAPTMKLIKEFGGIYHVNLLGLIIQSTKLNEEGEKILEAVKENPEWFRGELKYYRRTIERKKEEKRSTANNHVHDTPP
ncbi:replication initiation factor domain-containing protein [Enterococcus avium]|uniref:replication initiation factor domain-containing protein n=1 Tax=Enterococcus avium TaxID=33945 RepID=UPI001A97BA34|nr:replication initiation factor domain-containing protein [Enterococcus avium]